MSDHIQINGNVDIQGNDLDNVYNLNGESGSPINISPDASQSISASAPILGMMSGSNSLQLATQSYVNANGSIGASSFPNIISPLQLGTPTSPITSGSSYTYDINLGGTYTEVAITNFGWVDQNVVDTNEPGITLGRAVLSQQPQGGVLIANHTSGGWHRAFVMTPSEYQDGSGTPIVQKFNATSSDITNPLGYGATGKQCIMNNIQLETSPPGKLQVTNAYLNNVSGVTHLLLTVKNVDSGTFSLTAFFGVQLSYGYLGDIRWTTVNGSNMITLSEVVPEFYNWVSTDGGNTYHNFPVQQPISSYPNTYFETAGMCSWQTAGPVYHVGMLDQDGYLLLGSSASSYTWALGNGNSAISSGCGNNGLNGTFGRWTGGRAGAGTGTQGVPFGFCQPIHISSDASMMLLCAVNNNASIFKSTNQGTSFGSVLYTASGGATSDSSGICSNFLTTGGVYNRLSQNAFAYTKAINSTTAFSAFNFYGSFPTGPNGTCNALIKTTDGGTTWNQMLSHPEFIYASARVQYISDNGSDIFLACIGYGNGDPSGLYGDDVTFRFNKSTNGGSTWQYASGSWPSITNNTYIGGYGPYQGGNNYYNNTVAGGNLLFGNISNSIIMLVIYDVNGFANLTRSTDGGATWSTVNDASELSALNYGNGVPQVNFPGGNSASDTFLGFVTYGNANSTTQSFLYTGGQISTFTNWPVYAR